MDVQEVMVDGSTCFRQDVQLAATYIEERATIVACRWLALVCMRAVLRTWVRIDEASPADTPNRRC